MKQLRVKELKTKIRVLEDYVWDNENALNKEIKVLEKEIHGIEKIMAEYQMQLDTLNAKLEILEDKKHDLLRVEDEISDMQEELYELED